LAALDKPNVKVFNFGINGATAQVIDLLLQKILTPEQLPRLVVWADGARAFNSGAVDVTYDGIVASVAYRQLMAGTLPIPQTALAPDAPAVAKVPSRGVINQTLTESYAAIDRWFSQQLAQVSWGTYAERDRLKHLVQEQVGELLPEQFFQNQPIPGSEVAASPSGNPSTDPSANPVLADPSVEGAIATGTGEPLVNGEGFLSLPLQFNPATYYQKYAKVAGAFDSDYERFQLVGKQEAALQSVIAFTQAQKVGLVFVNLPLTDQYLDPVRNDYEQQFKQMMVRISLEQPGALVFRDLGDRWPTEYRYFSDPSHLNRYGAYAVGQQLAQDPMIPWVKGEAK
jgi:hypothetical protein